jgi:hypothetical protein
VVWGGLDGMISAALRNILITLALSDNDVRRFGGNDVVGSGADLTGRSETNCGAHQAEVFDI